MKTFLITIAGCWVGCLVAVILLSITGCCRDCGKRKAFYKLKTIMVDVGNSGYSYYKCKGECYGTAIERT